MDPDTVIAKVAEQLQVVRDSALTRAYGWELALEELVLLTTLQPRRHHDLRFLLQTTFDDFPRRAPSYVFVNAPADDPGRDPWPRGIRHGAVPPGICTPGTREFHEHYHRGDAGHPWQPDLRSVLTTLHEIQRLMERGMAS